MAKDSFFGLNEKSAEEIGSNLTNFGAEHAHDRLLFANRDDFLLADADASDFFLQENDNDHDPCAHAGFKLGSPLNYDDDDHDNVDFEEDDGDRSIKIDQEEKLNLSIVKQFHSYERCLNPDRSSNGQHQRGGKRDHRSISSTGSGGGGNNNSLNPDRSAVVSPGTDECCLNPDQSAKCRKISSNASSSSISTDDYYLPMPQYSKNIAQYPENIAQFFSTNQNHSIDFSTTNQNHLYRANSTRGAAYAKQYRQKNKQYVEGLHSALEEKNAENARLRSILSSVTSSLSESRRETAYLRNVIANQSELSELIRKVQTVVKPKSSRDQEKSIDNRQKSIDNRQSIDNFRQKSIDKKRPLPAGVCLHVSGGEISLEFCANCSTSHHYNNHESRRYLLLDRRLFYDDHLLPRLFYFVRRWAYRRIEP